MASTKKPEDNKFKQADLDELCLWLYGIYEEMAPES
jgi:hypothetical protein